MAARGLCIVEFDRGAVDWEMAIEFCARKPWEVAGLVPGPTLLEKDVFRDEFDMGGRDETDEENEVLRVSVPWPPL